MSDTWDFEHQRAETAWTVQDLSTRAGVKAGAKINLEMQFIPGENPDKQALVRAFGTFGYGVTVPGDEDMVQAEKEGVAFTADDIWLHEERCTKIALARGYVPDGWGFWEP